MPSENYSYVLDLYKLATAGVWVSSYIQPVIRQGAIVTVDGKEILLAYAGSDVTGERKANADLTAAAVTAFPALVSELKAAEDKIAQLELALSHLTRYCSH